MSTFVWFLFAVLYLTALIVLGLGTLRKGHYVLFVVGIFFPLLWIIGAVIGPTPRSAAGASAQAVPRVLLLYYSYTEQSRRVAGVMAEAFRVRDCEVQLAAIEFTDARYANRF